jgi:ubiquitin-like modifier-activating enzyme ATG7
MIYRGKPGPRVADLSQALDSSYLMAQAVDLNLRLMKWRLWPSLDTERLANTRCLLLGAGTLGCAVARALLGWGVRDITLVDSGRVSYSNPARQCLFEFEDCEMRSYKAVAAATRLRKIFPGVRSEGIVLSIPMAGHPLNMTHTHAPPGRDGGEEVPLGEESLISEDEAQFRRLDALVQSHDVCFALTDSREARWLPTVMCAAYGKLLINAALGFDTYLVMRHGQTATGHNTQARSTELSGQVPEEEQLGCYFCNDIVAATNSQKDRSLDQQCTVTRPGLSFIAAALAVELMVALAHPKNAEEGEDTNNVEEQAARIGGPVANTAAPEIPHQIRGSVAGFTQFTPHVSTFEILLFYCLSSHIFIIYTHLSVW